MIRRILFLIALATPSLARAELCTEEYLAGEKCRLQIKDLHPTQSDVGMAEVNFRRGRFHELKDHKKALRSFLKKNRLRVVIGPAGEFFLIDGHHRATAMVKEHLSDVYVRIEANFKGTDPEKFWQTMEKKKWTWLKDRAGNNVLPEQLPRRIGALGDNPYRSLAWAVMRSQAVRDSNIPFAEFEWAEYFRQHIRPQDIEKDFDAAVAKAVDLALDTKARYLPGYVPLREKAVRNINHEACWLEYRALLER